MPLGRVRASIERPVLQAVGRWVLAGACVLAVAGLLVHEASAAAGDRAVAAADAGLWLTAFGEASLAAGQDPDIHAYALTAGLAAAHVGDEETAARYLRIVAEADDLPEAWVDLAWVEAELGHTDAALEAARAALRLGSQRAPIAMAAAGVLIRLGAADEARAAFAAAVASRPTLAGDPWWQSPEVVGVVPSIEDLAMPVAAPEDRWEIALMVGDGVQAMSLASDTIVPGLARDVISAWTDPRAASKLLDACRDDPTDLDRLRWCARIAGHQGDPATADHFRALAEGISPGTSEGAAELRVAVRNDLRVPSTQVARYWGLYTYRRPTPEDLLVPGVIHLVLT
jgi:tetratricopeptide (TPR) repeat protein